MEKLIVFFLTCAMLVHLGKSIEDDSETETDQTFSCYSCDNVTCREDRTKWPPAQACGHSCAANFNCVPQCTKIVYYINNDITTKAIRRGCQISNTTKSDLNGSNCSTTLFGSQIVTILSCDVCTSDMCNSSPNYAAGLYSLVLPIFGYLVFDFTN